MEANFGFNVQKQTIGIVYEKKKTPNVELCEFLITSRNIVRKSRRMIMLLEKLKSLFYNCVGYPVKFFIMPN